MENTTRFDLNESVRLWRDALSASPAFQPDHLDELETHLRSSVERLQSAGLAANEAFMVARHRVGDATALEKEYGKINAGAIWASRIMWMVVGHFIYQSIFLTSGTISQIIIAFQPRQFPQYFGPPWLVSRIIAALLFLLFLWLMERWGRSASRTVEKLHKWSLAKPLLALLSLGVFFTGLYFLCLSTLWFVSWSFPDLGVRYGLARLQQFYLYQIGESIVIPSILIFLAQRKLRATVR